MIRTVQLKTLAVLVAAALAIPTLVWAQNLDQVLDQAKAKDAGAPGGATATAAQPSAPAPPASAPPAGAPGEESASKGTGDVRARNIFYLPPNAPAPIQPMPPVMVQPMPNAPLPPPVAPPSQPSYIGLRYKILLQGPQGEVREVPETFPFRSGMRFRLQFQPNITGYMYIFHKGSNSKGTRLFPEPRINGGQNFVQGYQEIMVPYTGWFRFDQTPGMEELYIFVTPQKLDTFNNLQCGPDGSLPEGGWQQVTAATSNYQYPRPDAARAMAGGPAPAPGMPPRAMEGQGGAQPGQPGGKNIVYEPEGAPQPICYTPPVVEPNNWQVNQPCDSFAVENAPMLIHHIRMQHRAY